MEVTKLEASIAALVNEVQILRTTVQQQQTEIAQLKTPPSPTAQPTSETLPLDTRPSPPNTRPSRRKLLKSLAVAAGVAAAGTALASSHQTAQAGYLGTFVANSTNSYGLSASPVGVTAFNPASGAGTWGVMGVTDASYVPSSFNTNVGVLGWSNNGSGVNGVTNNGTGVVGYSTNGNAVSGGSTNAYGAIFSGGKAPLFLVRNPGQGAPTTDSHQLGEFYVDDVPIDTGNLYFCTASGTPGTWARLNNPYTAGSGITISATPNANGTFTISSTGGGGVPNINLLPNAVRVAATIAPFNATPLKATGANPTIGDTSTVQLTIAGANGIPAGAKGVIGVLTNLGATAGGNLRFWTGGIAPTISNLNIPGALPSLNLTASFAIPLAANGKTYLGFGTGAIGATCGYVVDISGYWL